MLLKKGDRGEQVKTLQSMLGIKADGVFGSATEASVKAYQKVKGLVADGIVGDATWRKLTEGVQAVGKAVDACVIYDPLRVHITRSSRKIEYIVFHFTAGSSSQKGRAKACKKTFESREASADFVVDDADIVQYNPDLTNYYCWSVGGNKYNNRGGKYYGRCTNRNSVSIEICSTCEPATRDAVAKSNHKGWRFTDSVLANAVKIGRILRKKYGVPIDRCICHYDVTGKPCPGIIGWNEEYIYDLSEKKETRERSNRNEWEKFKMKLV